MYASIRTVFILVLAINKIFSIIMKMVNFILELGKLAYQDKEKNMDREFKYFLGSINLKGFS